MLSVTSGHGADYLTASVAGGRESYYLDATTDGEPPGQWSGAGADALGLSGEVENQDMEALYGSFLDPRDPAFHDRSQWPAGEHLGGAPRSYRSPDQVVESYLAENPAALPEDLAEVRARAERSSRSAVMFTDLTFGVPKSVTVLHASFQKAELEAQRNGDLGEAAQWAGRRAKVEAAIHAGNTAMLGYMAEKAGYVRTGGDRSGHATQFEDAHDWTVASFFQHTNRDLEPHLHIHNAVLNRVQAPDGRWLTQDGKSLRWWKQAGGAVAERVMQEQLSRTLGLTWQINEAGHSREVVGVEKPVMELFSGRTAKITERTAQLIEAAQERLGRDLTPLEHNRLRQQATLATRSAKTHTGETVEQMLDRWHAQLKAELAGGLHRVAARFEQDAPRADGEQVEITPGAVVARALDAVQKARATWTRPELVRQIDLALPDNLGGLEAADVVRLVERLTDAALDSQEVVQTAGNSAAQQVPAELQRPDGSSLYESPRAARFATREHVIAEEALRRATVDRSRLALDRAAVDKWLAAHADMLGADQAAAVRGITTSGASSSNLVGAAGAGKSHVAGALDAVWSQVGGGRLMGLAPTQAAAEVLRDDGVGLTANTAAWLAAQRRIADGTASEADREWALTERDIVLVDEASMVDTRTLTDVRMAVEAAGARVVLAGDPTQLSAVDAGGMFAALAEQSVETYHLQDVRRFHDGWERAASLRLRVGDPTVVREYDRHGRIIDGGDQDAALEAVARGYVGDRLLGKTSVIVTGSNEQAGVLSARVREELVRLGQVEADGVPLDRDGTTAGVGDVIAARRIDYGLGVLNRRQYEVMATREDGGLTVASLTSGQLHHLPAEYVAQHVTLGYAGTVHSTQGQTVDTSWALLDSRGSREAAYVAMTRGREHNSAVVVTVEKGDLGTDPDERSARAVFADVIERESAEKAAIAVIEEEELLARSAATVDAKVENAVRVACALRLQDHLDRMTEEGLLSEGQRARLGADRGSEYLSRVLRAAEQAGEDPEQVLREAVAGHDLSGARSLAQVLSWRVTSSVDLTRTDAATVPAGLSPGVSEYLNQLHTVGQARAEELAEGAVKEPPAWALAAFGPAPDDQAGRERWLHQVGAVTAHREASGWDSDDAAVGPAPGVHATERRASWHRAWDALGRPEAQAEEGDLSEGRLRNRVEAWRRTQLHAPHHADDYLKAASLAARAGEHAEAFAAAEGAGVTEDEQAATDTARFAATGLDDVARERGMWVAASAATREASVRADAELRARGIEVGAEPDRVTVQDYLLEVVADGDGAELVLRPVAAAPELVAVAGEVPTMDETAGMVRRAAWVGEVLADQQSADESYYGSGDDGWTAVEEESQAWRDAEGHEEAVIDTDAVDR